MPLCFFSSAQEAQRCRHGNKFRGAFCGASRVQPRGSPTFPNAAESGHLTKSHPGKLPQEETQLHWWDIRDTSLSVMLLSSNYHFINPFRISSHNCGSYSSIIFHLIFKLSTLSFIFWWHWWPLGCTWVVGRENYSHTFIQSIGVI